MDLLLRGRPPALLGLVPFTNEPAKRARVHRLCIKMAEGRCACMWCHNTVGIGCSAALTITVANGGHVCALPGCAQESTTMPFLPPARKDAAHPTSTDAY